jgi:restriction system protein
MLGKSRVARAAASLIRACGRAQLLQMRYELRAIEKWDTGGTELLLKDKVFVRFAEIPWAKAHKTQLFLNPANVAQLGSRVADDVDLFPKDTVPVFTPAELQTVLRTVKTQTTTIQSQNRKPFEYFSKVVESVVSVADLVLKAIIVPGEKTKEGVLIEAVTGSWFEIIKFLQKNPKDAFQIPPRKWEELVAGVYKEAGFDEVTLTPASGDLGRDVIAVKRGVGMIRVIDQVKAYKPGHLVTADEVRALFGVVIADNASKGFLTTTSDFAPRLKDDELLKPFIPSRLELINGTALLKRLEELAQKELG